MRVSYQLQRQLLVDSKHRTPFTQSLRSRQPPCVVVYVVVPSDSAAEVINALHVVAQALAPCSSLGLAEVADQLQQGMRVTVTTAPDCNAPAGAAGAPPTRTSSLLFVCYHGAPHRYSQKATAALEWLESLSKLAVKSSNGPYSHGMLVSGSCGRPCLSSSSLRTP